jgi:hypothetical protein
MILHIVEGGSRGLNPKIRPYVDEFFLAYLLGVVRYKLSPSAKRMVKVEDWAGRGFDLSSGQDWKSFVEALTGEVPGSIVVFPQP